ncbi:hypothetical protein DUNSADRAFT_6896 [Dunaliella salina]|uniref:RING-type E3 ubiquitin transferase n=1 Tax=Dunaliella salina TaxID=3046 RepID=A0ABQ7FTM8_DUNSA|nr:hypothetical protein DUNSADRAFT_6896 [Dunaliella salina]|eukprot:KAF5825800.1 hypothetical protein DUNSADRAFT_6896 [Dunaliella salina]
MRTQSCCNVHSHRGVSPETINTFPTFTYKPPAKTTTEGEEESEQSSRPSPLPHTMTAERRARIEAAAQATTAQLHAPFHHHHTRAWRQPVEKQCRCLLCVCQGVPMSPLFVPRSVNVSSVCVCSSQKNSLSRRSANGRAGEGAQGWVSLKQPLFSSLECLCWKCDSGDSLSGQRPVSPMCVPRGANVSHVCAKAYQCLPSVRVCSSQGSSLSRRSVNGRAGEGVQEWVNPEPSGPTTVVHAFGQSSGNDPLCMVRISSGGAGGGDVEGGKAAGGRGAKSSSGGNVERGNQSGGGEGSEVAQAEGEGGARGVADQGQEKKEAEEDEEPTCSVCLCEYEEGDLLRRLLPCNHEFHCTWCVAEVTYSDMCVSVYPIAVATCCSIPEYLKMVRSLPAQSACARRGTC